MWITYRLFVLLHPYLQIIVGECLGTVIKWGVEGILIIPLSMTRKQYKAFRELGEGFASNGGFDASIVERLRKPMRIRAAQ